MKREATFRDAANYQHGPSTAVRCPACGAPLAIQEDVEMFTPAAPATRTIVRVAWCGRCSFVHRF